jgi:hypothetical protein
VGNNETTNHFTIAYLRKESGARKKKESEYWNLDASDEGLEHHPSQSNHSRGIKDQIEWMGSNNKPGLGEKHNDEQERRIGGGVKIFLLVLLSFFCLLFVFFWLSSSSTSSLFFCLPLVLLSLFCPLPFRLASRSLSSFLPFFPFSNCLLSHVDLHLARCLVLLPFSWSFRLFVLFWFLPFHHFVCLSFCIILPRSLIALLFFRVLFLTSQRFGAVNPSAGWNVDCRSLGLSTRWS